MGVVAEGKYLTRGGVKDLKTIFDREVEQNLWIKDRLSVGQCTGEYFITSEYSRHSRYWPRWMFPTSAFGTATRSRAIG